MAKVIKCEFAGSKIVKEVHRDNVTYAQAIAIANKLNDKRDSGKEESIAGMVSYIAEK